MWGRFIPCKVFHAGKNATKTPLPGVSSERALLSTIMALKNKHMEVPACGVHNVEPRGKWLSENGFCCIGRLMHTLECTILKCKRTAIAASRHCGATSGGQGMKLLVSGNVGMSWQESCLFGVIP